MIWWCCLNQIFYEPILNSDVNESQTIDDHIGNYQLLNEFNVNDIESFVKSNPFVLSDTDLRTCSQPHHQNHFDDFKLIDFPVMWERNERTNERTKSIEPKRKKKLFILFDF